MRILADENMPGLESWTEAGCELTTMPGRQISRSDLRDIDVLLVRSVTRVDENLLHGNKVQFVGTATSGIDHIDKAYLELTGIRLATAAGANARSVTDYVFSALAVLCLVHNVEWLDKRIGIIGGGNVGGLLCRQLTDAGASVALYDPFLGAENPYSKNLCSLDTVLGCDLISLHTPLTSGGAHPTQHMFNKEVIMSLDEGQILVNTARGEVVDNIALLRQIESGSMKVVLDVWEGEPMIDKQLAEHSVLATPHIAGYSTDSKIKATKMLFAAFSQWAGISTASGLNNGQSEKVVLSVSDANRESSLSRQLSAMILQAYDVREDDGRFRQELGDCKNQAAVGHCFDWQRKHYPARREFTACQIEGGEATLALRQGLEALGFTVV